jgi:hypothetical protein
MMQNASLDWSAESVFNNSVGSFDILGRRAELPRGPKRAIEIGVNLECYTRARSRER